MLRLWNDAIKKRDIFTNFRRSIFQIRKVNWYIFCVIFAFDGCQWYHVSWKIFNETTYIYLKLYWTIKFRFFSQNCCWWVNLIFLLYGPCTTVSITLHETSCWWISYNHYNFRVENWLFIPTKREKNSSNTSCHAIL